MVVFIFLAAPVMALFLLSMRRRVGARTEETTFFLVVDFLILGTFAATALLMAAMLWGVASSVQRFVGGAVNLALFSALPLALLGAALAGHRWYLKGSTTPEGPEWGEAREMTERIARSYGLRRAVGLRLGAHPAPVAVASARGRSWIVLPPATRNLLVPGRRMLLEATLAHELAHVAHGEARWFPVLVLMEKVFAVWLVACFALGAVTALLGRDPVVHFAYAATGALVLAASVPFLRFGFRARERQADALAGMLVGASALRSALRYWEVKRVLSPPSRTTRAKEFLARVWASAPAFLTQHHPALPERAAALLVPREDLVGARAPSRAIALWVGLLVPVIILEMFWVLFPLTQLWGLAASEQLTVIFALGTVAVTTPLLGAALPLWSGDPETITRSVAAGTARAFGLAAATSTAVVLAIHVGATSLGLPGGLELSLGVFGIYLLAAAGLVILTALRSSLWLVARRRRELLGPEEGVKAAVLLFFLLPALVLFLGTLPAHADSYDLIMRLLLLLLVALGVGGVASILALRRFAADTSEGGLVLGMGSRVLDLEWPRWVLRSPARIATNPSSLPVALAMMAPTVVFLIVHLAGMSLEGLVALFFLSGAALIGHYAWTVPHTPGRSWLQLGAFFDLAERPWSGHPPSPAARAYVASIIRSNRRSDGWLCENRRTHDVREVADTANLAHLLSRCDPGAAAEVHAALGAAVSARLPEGGFPSIVGSTRVSVQATHAVVVASAACGRLDALDRKADGDAVLHAVHIRKSKLPSQDFLAMARACSEVMAALGRLADLQSVVTPSEVRAAWALSRRDAVASRDAVVILRSLGDSADVAEFRLAEPAMGASLRQRLASEHLVEAEAYLGLREELGLPADAEAWIEGWVAEGLKKTEDLLAGSLRWPRRAATSSAVHPVHGSVTATSRDDD